MNDNNILTLLFEYKKIRIVEKKFLKESLADATIFKRLFNLDENNPFGNYSLNIENGCITLPRDLYVSASSWDLLIHFLKYGYTLHFHTNTDNRKMRILEETCNICNIFGGIPSFDIFYNKCMENTDYNPITPNNDIKCLYDWKALTHYNFKDIPNSDEWNVTTHVNDCTNVFYYRKLKKVV
jgi:hypothetical protein